MFKSCLDKNFLHNSIICRFCIVQVSTWQSPKSLKRSLSSFDKKNFKFSFYDTKYHNCRIYVNVLVKHIICINDRDLLYSQYYQKTALIQGFCSVSCIFSSRAWQLALFTYLRIVLYIDILMI